MKKRKVKYNPNKPLLNPVRKFQLFGEAIEENRTLELWQVLNGREEHEAPEIGHLLTIVKGDLVIAMRKFLIDEMQSFHIWSEIHAEHPDGRQVKLEYEISVPERMTYSDFLCGDGEDWKGANALMDEYFQEVTEPGFKIVKQPYTVTCMSAFRNLKCAMEFKKIQLVTLGNGLGVAS